MTRIIVLGASGALGKHVAQQAVDAGHDVSVVVRTPSKLPAAWRDRVNVHHADMVSRRAHEHCGRGQAQRRADAFRVGGLVCSNGPLPKST